jgi:ABC-type cobalamin/Fe3+-siderophores transport system ATPase subunit
MMFKIVIPRTNSDELSLPFEPGQLLFVLGANGAGKSSLMMKFSRENHGQVVKIASHRQTWLNADVPDMTVSQVQDISTRITYYDTANEARTRDNFASHRPMLSIIKLVKQISIRDRKIADAIDDNNYELAKNISSIDSPLEIINNIFKQSNLKIEIFRTNDNNISVKKDTEEYGLSSLSDGERNALFLCSDVLNAPEKSLFLIDEPERNLHRSIILPLLVQLFQSRIDCGFVISTHDHELPLKFPESKALLLRSCLYNNGGPQSWDVDLIPVEQAISDDLKCDLLGARRKVLFVEGTETSLDRPLYNLLFPEVSVIPKGDCREVEKAVSGVRSTEEINWLSAFGIVDSDGFDQHEIEKKREKGVYAVPFYSVEAIYYHPEIIRKIAERNAQFRGGNAEQMAQAAIDGAINAVRNQVDRLTRPGVKKAIRKEILDQIPDDDKLMNNTQLIINYDSLSIYNNKIQQVNNAIDSGDWLNALVHCKIRSSDARGAIIRELKYTDYVSYETSVIKLINDCQETREFARGLFADLFGKLSQDASGF